MSAIAYCVGVVLGAAFFTFLWRVVWGWIAKRLAPSSIRLTVTYVGAALSSAGMLWLLALDPHNKDMIWVALAYAVALLIWLGIDLRKRPKSNDA